MAHLTKQQTELIYKEIEQRGISHPDLKEDLLDHVCSAVEAFMASGESFEKAYTKAMSSFGQNELKRVQVKTQALLAGETIYYPNIKQSFGLLLLYVILLFMTGLIAWPVMRYYSEITPQYVFLIQTIQVSGCLLLVIALAKHELKERSFTSVDIFPLNAFPLSIFPIIIAILFLWSIWMEMIESWIILRNSIQAYIDGFLPPYSPFTVLLFLVILWPLLSEILFRGIILKGMLRKYTPLKAIMCSSILFSVSLLNPHDMPFLFLTGMFCGWLFYRTHSLFLSILVQILAILPVIVQIVWTKPRHYAQLLIWRNMIGNDALYYSLGFVSFLLTIFLLWRLKKMFDKQENIAAFSLE